MSDNIPIEIQMEIIKKVSNLKSLIQFRSVSKTWKSFIDSSDFIKDYGTRNTQPHSHILKYEVKGLPDHKYICFVDDDNQSFKVQQQQQEEFAPFVMSPMLEQYISDSFVIGTCHGLMALHCYHKVDKTKRILVIWNPFIGKSFGINLPGYGSSVYISTSYGFGVCPVTRDPTVVKIVDAYNRLDVEVFTLSSGVWNVIQGGHLLRQSIKVYWSGQAVDRFIYWGAHQTTFLDYRESIINHMVLSFDLITKEFKVVDLPDSLINELRGSACVSVSKLRESLVVYGAINVEGSEGCGVWVMDHDSSFRKLFTIPALVRKILGFSKSGEAIFEIDNREGWCATLNVYDPCSQQIKNLGISGISRSFFMGSYKESLLLLDQLDSHIY